MGTVPRSVLTLVLAALVTHPAVAGSRASTSQTSVGRVIGVSDGDTITVLVGGRPLKVRVEGVDCPERGQPYGRAAKNFTSQHVFGRVVEVQFRERDQYGRLVGRVRAGDEDLGLALLSAGLAWHYTQYSNDRTYAQAEQQARARRAGLWSQSDPVPPWVERRARRDGRRVPLEPPVRGPAAGPIRGNVRSHVFHAPGCPNSHCKQCTASFASEREAIAQGYRPAGDCHPGGR